MIAAERTGPAGSRTLESDARTLTVVGCLIGQSLKLHKAIERLQDEFRRQRQEFEKTIRKTYRIESIIGQSKRMQEVFAAVTSVAPLPRATVLLRGESGHGEGDDRPRDPLKRAAGASGRSSRSTAPPSRRPCWNPSCSATSSAAPSPGAVDDRKGRFEEADGGTIFLDEIGDMPAADCR